jgi:hypothetical protein
LENIVIANFLTEGRNMFKKIVSVKNVIVCALLTGSVASASAETTIVSGTGRASCPSGYVMTGLIPTGTVLVRYMRASGFYGCATVNQSGVSGCRHGYVTQKDDVAGNQGYGYADSHIKLICAKVCQ